MTKQTSVNFTLSNGQTQVMIIPYKDGSFSLVFLSVDGTCSRYNTVESKQKATISIRNIFQLKWLSKFLSDAEPVLIEDSSSVYSGRVI